MTGFTGTAALARLALRRDRVRLPIWLCGLTALLAAQAAGNADIYQSAPERTAAAALLATNPGTLLLRGPAANTSLGALVMSDAFWILAVLTALLSAMTVVRHTRQNEETGRGELIAAAPVGPYASLTAAITVTVAANLALAGLLALALASARLPLSGCLAAGASVAATGIAFAGIAAVAVQISASSRAATAAAVVAVGAAYLLRGVGDVQGPVDPSGVTVNSAWLSWLSPIGWGQQVRPFADNTWWLLTLPAAMFTASIAITFPLTTRRDFGSGLFPARGGRPAARRSLLSPLGLAWRLQRGTLLGWAVGMTAAGALFGSVGQQVDRLSDNPQFIQAMGRLGGTGISLTETFFAATMSLVGAISAGYPLRALLRMRAEESSGRLEPILATAVSRTRWMTAHITCAVLGTLTLLLLTGATAGLVHGQATSDTTDQLAALTGAALVQAPASLTLAGYTIAVFGLVPRWAEAFTWAGLTLVLLLGPLGEIVNLPNAVRDISPFTHTPAAPATDVTATPVIALLTAATALAATGLAAFRRRDLALPA